MDHSKRGLEGRSASPSKRPCTASSPPRPPASFSLGSEMRGAQSIETILQLPEDAVYSLRKQDLRTYFFALQQHLLQTSQIITPTSPTIPSPPSRYHKLISSVPIELPALLRLPLEIRRLIYTYTLPPPVDQPIRGPHPRQLQSALLLTQPLTPATSLLAVNHKIRTECLPLFWGAPTQTVHVKIDYNIWAHKTRRSDLILSSALTSSIKHLHISIHLGNEKRSLKSGSVTGSRSNGEDGGRGVESEARISEVKKGIRKLGKWLSGADVLSLMVSWQEPPQTFTWEQKRGILDGMRMLKSHKVVAGEINWGLKWNKGRKYRFEVDYLKELERYRQVSGTP